jgi:hypothetical protein
MSIPLHEARRTNQGRTTAFPFIYAPFLHCGRGEVFPLDIRRVAHFQLPSLPENTDWGAPSVAKRRAGFQHRIPLRWRCARAYSSAEWILFFPEILRKSLTARLMRCPAATSIYRFECVDQGQHLLPNTLE